MNEEDMLFAGHRDACGACRVALASVPELHDDVAVIDAAALSALTRQRLEPLLAERRVHLWRRQVAVGLVLALIPLPFILAWDAVAVRWLYAAASELLPARIVAYALASYGAAMLLLFGLTYASIPVWFAHRGVARVPRLEWKML